jgi:hypothetical protein
VPYGFFKVSNLTFETLTYLPMQKGDLLVYDHRVVHASPVNKSGKTRLAMGIAAVPKEAQILHYRFNENLGLVEKYEIDEQFYIKYTYGKNEIPDVAKLLGTEPLVNPSFENSDIEKILQVSTTTKIKVSWWAKLLQHSS